MKRWLARWLGNSHPQLSAQQQQRLAEWRRLSPVSQDRPVDELRCVVIDVETTGLNLSYDRLLSIGAVAVVNGKISFADSFYIELQQSTASHRDNILIHGIGTTAQLGGAPPVEALLAFLEYLGKAPLIAFHAAFDETMIRRSIKEYLGFSLKHSWLDLAYLMPGLNSTLANKFYSLDDWIGHFGISIDTRHNALADALATAQLFEVSLAQARKKNVHFMSGLHNLEKTQRWVNTVS